MDSEDQKLTHLGVQHSAVLWFSDGDIVIQAATVAFGVYAKELAEYSSVFADMLSLPQPADGLSNKNDMVEGIPAVRLFDSDEDVELFLRAISNNKFFPAPPSPTDLSLILEILRLGNKYDIHALLKRAIAHLEADYPPSLPEFLTVPPQGLINHTDGPLLLPTIHYVISCFPLRNFATSAWAKLSAPNQMLVLTTHAKRVERLRQVSDWMLNFPDDLHNHSRCEEELECAYAAAGTAYSLFDVIKCDEHVDPLQYWSSKRLDEYRHERCEPCKDGLEEAFEASEQSVGWAARCGWPARVAGVGEDESGCDGLKFNWQVILAMKQSSGAGKFRIRLKVLSFLSFSF
ncbi:hypothetical protein C8J57DRAFT_1541516 [Mycena rebaudengoi]|nr:hypothetical protein C8J57DRAFT_1541516 [Mycena rebaudengoi]